ncbi:hypothetical protein [Lactobacillus acetotolerans]
MTDIKKLVDLAESLIPKVQTYGRHNFWDNLKRQYYQCVWLTVRKVEVEE